MTTTFTLPDLNCGGCAAAVKNTLSREPGVQAVDVTVAAKRVRIAFDPAATSPDRLAAALAAVGYPPERRPQPAPSADARLDAALSL
jgi:copper chaperone CopZ